MKFNVKETNGISVIAIEGRLDTQTAPEAQKKLLDII